MKRRQTLALGASLALPGLSSAPALAAKALGNGNSNGQAGERVLRYAFQIAETGAEGQCLPPSHQCEAAPRRASTAGSMSTYFQNSRTKILRW